ncbi:hypothetical protein HMPREF0491_00158 [Lachnospiraceae oral taxon 107 str. F0167]|nr:hypothetical protein HMPREF0491_00158 [Lachnospiraceae oral taxon 107 str. F0167]
MSENLLSFIIWAISGCLIIAIGISCFFSKKQAGFWANVNPPKVKDVKGYNHATGKLFVLFGVLLIVFGVPILFDKSSVFMLLTIATMAVYVLYIEEKYREK